MGVLAFAGLALSWLLAPQGMQLWLPGIGAVVFDLGVQATLIAHQTLVYRIDPAARSRLNAVLFIGMFTGMASGSVLGSVVLSSSGWAAVMGLSALAAVGALWVRLGER